MIFQSTIELDKSTSSVTWKVSHYGLSKYTARFAQIESSLYWDPYSFKKSRMITTVSPILITTDYPYKREKDFDHELSFDEGWFNAKKYDSIKFYSKKIEKTGERTGKIYGTLSMLGKKRPLVLYATSNKGLSKHPVSGKTVMGFSATGTIKRSDWGMVKMPPDIGDEVEIFIEAEFIKKRN